MTDTEAIRAAFAVIADEAPSPERIQASLARRGRQHRQRRIILRAAGVGAAAVTVGAAGVSGWQRLRGSGTELPTVDGGPGGGWLEVPLRYHPRWLPGGYGQSGRTVLVMGDQATVVSLDWQRGDETVSISIGWHEILEPNRPTGHTEQVDLHGVAGQVIRTNGDRASHYVIWQPPGQPQLIVSVLTDDEPAEQRTLALRMARSVQPDTGHTWVGPRFGWLPADLATAPWHHAVGHDRENWRQDLSTLGAKRQLLVSIGPDVEQNRINRDAATPIRVRGFDGWQVPENGQIFLTLGDGTQVSFELSTVNPEGAPGQTPDPVLPELIRVVEEFDFGPWPDMTWVGSR